MTDAPHSGSSPGPGAAGDLVGSILAGRYRILAKLGEGAMGAVYVGEHLKIGRKDAIKVLNDSLANDREAALRFMRGARNVSAIRHPNVCTIYDFSDTADGFQFMAMELVPGETLKELLEREGSLSIERAVDIAAQAADALDAAHDAGIVHRDLKPANIMVAPGKRGADVVKVVDFDIAKGSKEGEGEEVTRMGFVVGTPEYMSPEQLIGEALDGRSDVYSLALVLFRMLSGALPFRSKGTQDLMIERLTETPLRLDEVQPEAWPAALQAALDRALQRRAEDRTASAAAFAAELRAALGGPVVDAGAFGTSGPVGARLGTAGAGATPVSATTVGAAAGVAGGRASPSDVPDLPPTAVAPAHAAGSRTPGQARIQGNKRRFAIIGGGTGLLVVLLVSAVLLIDRGPPEPNPDNGGGGDNPGELGGGGQQNDGGQRGNGGGDLSNSGGDDSGRAGNDANGGGRRGGSNGRDPGSDDSGDGSRSSDGGNTGGGGGRQGPGSGAIVVSAAGAFDRLFDLLDRMDRSSPRSTVAAARDTARAYYDLGNQLSASDRAQAAYVVAFGYSTLDDIPQMKVWAERALELNPGHQAARTLLTRGGGNDR